MGQVAALDCPCCESHDKDTLYVGAARYDPEAVVHVAHQASTPLPISIGEMQLSEDGKMAEMYAVPLPTAADETPITPKPITQMESSIHATPAPSPDFHDQGGLQVAKEMIVPSSKDTEGSKDNGPTHTEHSSSAGDLLDRLQGAWYRDDSREKIGTIRGNHLLWEDAFLSPAAKLVATGADTLTMELAGEIHTGKYTEFPLQQLAWSDGEVWIRDGRANPSSSIEAKGTKRTKDSGPAVPTDQLPVLISKVQGAWYNDHPRHKIGIVSGYHLLWEDAFQCPAVRLGAKGEDTITMELGGETHAGKYSDFPLEQLTWSDGEVWIRE